MNFASPWGDRDVPDSDGNSMKDRRALVDLEEDPDPTWGETVMDVGASMMALAHLGVDKGLWSEKEFIAAKMRALHMLEQERKRRQDAGVLHTMQALRAQLRIIRDAVLAWSQGVWGDRSLDCVEVHRRRPSTSSNAHLPFSRTSPGMVSARVTIPEDGHSGEVYQFSLRAHVAEATESIPGWYEPTILYIILTPEERARSPVSLEFDNIIRDQNMENVNGVYQRRVTGLDEEGGDDGELAGPE